MYSNLFPLLSIFATFSLIILIHQSDASLILEAACYPAVGSILSYSASLDLPAAGSSKKISLLLTTDLLTIPLRFP